MTAAWRRSSCCHRVSARVGAADQGTAKGGPCVQIGFAEEGKGIPLDALPALAKPRRLQQLQESTAGCVLVLTFIALFTGFAYIAMSATPDFPPTLRLVILLVMGAEALFALLCLAVVLFGDPGIIRRSPETCAKMPGEVADCLRSGDLEPILGMANVILGERSFCVRCLVWRPSKLRPHHCSVCQRCVLHFDHHCQVLGRCIAGQTPFKEDGNVVGSGNMIFFDGLFFAAATGLITSLAAVIAAVAMHGL